MSSTLQIHPVRPSQAAAETAPPPRARDPWFDNAKMILVILVVVGHSWVLLPNSPVRDHLYDFLYLWHVPAFVMVTGYLSRSFTWSRRNLSRLVTTVALPYVVFEAAIGAFRTHLGGEDLDAMFADPHWPMWYLAALFVWRLATPLMKSPLALPGAVVISLAGGLVTAQYLDLARTMGLLPFFVLGLQARSAHVDRLRAPASRLAAIIVIAVAFLASRLLQGSISTEWLYWRSGYPELDASFGEGVLYRAGLLVAATFLALAFLAFVPRRASWFSRLGAATLVVYLFHGFFVKALEYNGVPRWTGEHPALGLLVFALGATALALALAAPPVARRLNVVVDPVAALQRRRKRSSATSTSPERERSAA